jgi:hypothetical protein
MKILKNIFICSLLMVLAISCDKGIDPITPVAPGPDESAPTVTINYPLEGTFIRDTLAVSTITIKLEAVDDIELKKVTLLMDGNEIKSYTSFIDYRRAVIEYPYSNVALGDHILSVVVTDMTDKTGSQSVNFKKVEPYEPLDGEVFYMPFDGDYTDLVKFVTATEVGSPGFASGKIKQSYAGATDSYLQFPTAGLLGKEFSTTFWYKLNATPLRAGILSISNTPPVPVQDSTRKRGFRLARENSGANQNLFVNFGIDSTEVWMNPFYQTASTEWMHIAVSISQTHATIYVNGAVVKEATLIEPINWAGCTSLSIGSGMPNFSYWEHFSDLSLIDDLRIFNKALSADEVTQIFTGK